LADGWQVTGRPQLGRDIGEASDRWQEPWQLGARRVARGSTVHPEKSSRGRRFFLTGFRRRFSSDLNRFSSSPVVVTSSHQGRDRLPNAACAIRVRDRESGVILSRRKTSCQNGS